MESESLDGWWWLPDRHDDAQFGRLFASQSGRWRLDVFGGLEAASVDEWAWLRVPEQMATAPLIYGRLVPGATGPRFVTLINCQQQAANRNVGGAANGQRTESWTFEEFVSGHQN